MVKRSSLLRSSGICCSLPSSEIFSFALSPVVFVSGGLVSLALDAPRYLFWWALVGCCGLGEAFCRLVLPFSKMVATSGVGT